METRDCLTDQNSDRIVERKNRVLIRRARILIMVDKRVTVHKIARTAKDFLRSKQVALRFPSSWTRENNKLSA